MDDITNVERINVMPTASRKNYQNREVLDRDISRQIRGKKTGLLFLHYRLLGYISIPSLLSLSLSFQLCDGRGIGADNFNEEAKRRSFKKKSHSSAGRKN